MIRLLQVSTKSMHSDLLPSKQAICTFKAADYDFELDLDQRRAIRIAAKTERRGEYFKAPYWLPLEDVKDWIEDESNAVTLVPAPPVSAKGKGAA